MRAALFRVVVGQLTCKTIRRCNTGRLHCCTFFSKKVISISCIRQFGVMSRERTFCYDETLPPLKVPELKNTIDKYLDSVHAVASEAEYENTKALCQKFLNDEAPKLQNYLKVWEKEHKNWIEKWWLERGYLDLRMPLPFMNFTGTPSFLNQFWPPQDNTQIERMAMSMYNLAQFYYLLRNEKIEVNKSNSGVTFSMDQFRTAFSSCQTPHKGRDQLDCYFKTASEGSVPLHVILLYKGRVFKLDIYSPKHGRPYTPPQNEKALRSVIGHCDAEKKSAPGIAALTSLDRDSWADARNHLMSISESNAKNLEAVESAIGVFSMDDSRADTCGETLFNVLTGDPAQRWRDKSYNEVFSRNGAMGACCAHSAMDGMVMVMYMEFATFLMKKCKGKWTGSKNADEISKIEEMEFVVDEKIAASIEEGKKVTAKFTDDLWLTHFEFPKFGRKEMKRLKIYPDAIMQISFQLAYMTLHGKPAPTYETATTRQFYHGRTETCRTCTPETVAFCRAAIDASGKPDSNTCALLKAASDKFAYLMDECRNNRGCDRHLFGLSIAAEETGTPLPELFRDPMYQKTGGGGNFVLSTSFVGFFNSSGVVAPMLADGYGVFYRIKDEKIILTMTSWRHSKETNLHVFADHVTQALCDVLEMFRHMNESKL